MPKTKTKKTKTKTKTKNCKPVPGFRALDLVDVLELTGTVSAENATLLRSALTKRILIRCHYGNQIASVSICDDFVKVSGEYKLESVKDEAITIREV